MAATAAPVSPGREVPLWRLHLLRVVFLLIALLGFLVHPQWIIDPSPTNRGMIFGFTGGLWVMSFFGLRYPLKMLPILLLEFVFKTLWLLRFGLPQWMAGRVDPQLSEDLWLIGGPPILLLFIIPWGYVWRHYFQEPAERWR
jgi:hypothetical protein